MGKNKEDITTADGANSLSSGLYDLVISKALRKSLNDFPEAHVELADLDPEGSHEELGLSS